MTEEELRAVIERHPIEGSPTEMRTSFAALAAEAPAGLDGVSVERKPIGGVRCLVVTPDGEAAEGGSVPPIVHLHGGGYVFGSPETHLGLASTLARSAGRRVVLPAYRLAPEHPWPAQREDALAVAAAMDGPFVLSGDSAGGHLAVAAGAAGARPERVLLFSPNTSRDYAASATRGARADAMNGHDADDRLARMAFGVVRADDPDQTLGEAAVGTLPPVWLDVGTDEVLLDDALRLSGLMARTGRAHDLHVRNGFHMIQVFASRYALGRESLERAGAWLRSRQSAASG